MRPGSKFLGHRLEGLGGDRDGAVFELARCPQVRLDGYRDPGRRDAQGLDAPGHDNRRRTSSSRRPHVDLDLLGASLDKWHLRRNKAVAAFPASQSRLTIGTTLPGLGLGLLTGLVSAMLTGLDPGPTAVSLSVVFKKRARSHAITR